MEALKEISESIEQQNSYKLLSLLRLSNKMTFTESKTLLLIGSALKFSTHLSQIKKYLKMLGNLNDITLKGLPSTLSEDYMYNFIEDYYKSLKELYNSSIPENFKHYIQSKISEFILDNSTDFFEEFSRSLGSKKSRQISHIKGWINSKFIDLEASKHLLMCIEKGYLQNRRVSTKYEDFHMLNTQLSSTILKSNHSLLQTSNDCIGKLFENALILSKKFLKNKSASDHLFQSALDFIFCCLSTPLINEVGIKNSKLLDKSQSYALGNYYTYFFESVVNISGKPFLAGKVTDLAKGYFLSFLLTNPDFVSPTLSCIQKQLKTISESNEANDAIIDLVFEIISQSITQKSSDYDNLILIYLQEHIITNLSLKSNLDIMNKLIPLIQDTKVHNVILQQVFSVSHELSKDIMVKSLGSLCVLLQDSSQVTTIIEFFLSLYQRETSNDLLYRIINNLQKIAEKFAGLVFDNTLSVLVDYLLLFEKQE